MKWPLIQVCDTGKGQGGQNPQDITNELISRQSKLT